MAGGIDFKAVADAMTAEQFARHELQMRGNRARCPFNPHEARYNLSFMPNGRAFCFSCQMAYDTVQLAAKTWNVSQLDAARQLNDVYRLGVSAETMTQAERDRREQARREARELQERVKQAENAEWARACEAEQAAQAEIERFTPADVDKIEFDQALRRLCAAQLRCEVLQAARAEG